MTPTLNTTEAAELLKVHPKTIEELIHSGAIPAAKIGRAWVMLTADVLAYAEAEIKKQTASRMRATSKEPATPISKGAKRPRKP